MVDDNSVTHFLSVELNGIDEVCSAIDDSFSYKIDRTISCEVLNRKLYSLGKYQDDILHGRAQVLKASIVKIDKKQQKDNFIDERRCINQRIITIVNMIKELKKYNRKQLIQRA